MVDRRDKAIEDAGHGASVGEVFCRNRFCQLSVGTLVIRLRDTVIPLMLAPLAGATVVACWEYWENPGQWVYTILAGMAAEPFCYAAEALLVVPVLWLSPQCRTPRLLVAAVWGVGVAWFVAACVTPGLRDLTRPVAAGFGAAGAVSGLAFAFLARPRRSQ
jgi:hypothetical protein